MWFGLLIVLPITIIIWLALRLIGKRADFERLHEGIGCGIIGAFVAVLGVAVAGATLLQIWRHLWVLLILVPLIVVFSMIDARDARVRRRRDNRPPSG